MTSIETPERQLQLRLKKIADELDRTPERVDVESLYQTLRQFEDLGVTDLMTPAESARVSVDNLPEMLKDIAGRAALGDALALGARLIDTYVESEIRDWWGGTEPEVLIANDTRIARADLFYTFGGALIQELLNGRNLLAVPAPDVEHFDPDALWPPVHSVVTSHPEFRDWAFSWGGQLVWWESTPDGFRVERQSPLGTEDSAEFAALDIPTAVRRVADWIEEPPGIASGSYLTVSEHRALEVVLLQAHDALSQPGISAEVGLQTNLLLEILRLQLRAPEPDRTIVGRALQGVASFAGGVLTGVAATYLTSLLVRFGLPPP